MVDFTDLKIYKTTNNLGGAITATEFLTATPNNLFGNVPQNEQVIGEDYYACVYIKNTHLSEAMGDLKIWQSSKSFPPDTQIKWGFDTTAVAQTITNKYTAPSGITWHGIETQSTATSHGELLSGASFPIWLWLHVNANAVARLDDSSVFTSNLTIEQCGSGSSGSGGSGGGTGGNPPPTNTDWKIAIVGDEGCEPETDDVIDLIQANNYDYVVSVGDHAYEAAGCWTGRFDVLKPNFNSAYGNHEYSESGGVTPYKTFFAHSKTYFSFQFQNVFFLVGDDNIDIDPGGTQHNFITSECARVLNDPTITWRIFVNHHPWFGASSDHPYDEFNQVESLHQLLQSSKFNIVCTGHNHNWQRTKQVKYNSSNPTSPSVVSSSSPFLRSAVGIIHVVSGTGGHDTGSGLYSLGSQPSFQGYQNRTHNGIWEIVATNNAQTLTCSFVEVGGDKFDTIVITAD